MSFSQGLLQAVGFSAGMSLHQKQEVRPILRKRLLSNVVYVCCNVWIILHCLSLHGEILEQHVFTKHLDRLEMFRPLSWLYTPWAFTWVTAGFALTIFCIAFLANLSSERSAFNFGKVWFVVVTLAFAVFAYAMVYDAAYYYFGNSCTPYLRVGCINIGNSADTFGLASAGVYLLRSLFVLLPKEHGTIVFFGGEVLDIFGSTVYLIPTAPLPHSVCVALTYAFEMTPLFHDLYQEPDGRERATAIYHNQR